MEPFEGSIQEYVRIFMPGVSGAAVCQLRVNLF